MSRTLFFGILSVLLTCQTQAQDPVHWWAGGDGFGDTGLSSERNTLVADGRVYDDFDVLIRSTVHGAWGNFILEGFTPSQAYYEIRSGVRRGYGGLLHAAGVMVVRVSPTGRLAKMRYPEYLVRGGFAEPVTLDPGHYWITVAPMGHGLGRSYVSNTLGSDWWTNMDDTPPPMGTTSSNQIQSPPRRNGNAFFDSVTFGKNFVDARDELGSGLWDFALGMGPNTGPPTHSFPSRFWVTYGEHVGGDIYDLYTRNSGYVTITRRLYDRASAPNVQLILEGTAPFDAVGYLALTADTSVSAKPQEAVFHRMELFDFLNQRWQTIFEGSADSANFGAAGAVTLDTDHFIEPETQHVRAALSWFDRGSTVLDWTAYIDQVYWTSEPK